MNCTLRKLVDGYFDGFLIFLTLSAFLSLCVFSGETLGSSQVDGDKALQSIGKPSWYDKADDTYAPPRLSEQQDNPIRREGWIAEKANQKKKEKAKAASSSTNTPWNFGFTGIDTNAFSAIVLGALGVALITVVVLLTLHSLRNYMPGRWEKKKSPTAIEIDPAKVSDLPFEVTHSSYDNPLAQAESLMRAGNYREAILFLYGYMLLALDRSRKIDLQRGKTNRMYLRELGSRTRLRAIVETAMLSFEDVYFGKHTISRERFMQSWDAMEEFHRLASETSVEGVATTFVPGVSPA